MGFCCEAENLPSPNTAKGGDNKPIHSTIPSQIHVDDRVIYQNDFPLNTDSKQDLRFGLIEVGKACNQNQLNRKDALQK